MITRKMLKMAVAGLDVDITTAAALCGIGRSTLARMHNSREEFDKARPATLRRIENGLSRSGVEWREGGWVRVIKKQKRALGESDG